MKGDFNGMETRLIHAGEPEPRIEEPNIEAAIQAYDENRHLEAAAKFHAVLKMR